MCLFKLTSATPYNLDKALRYIRFSGIAYCTDPQWSHETVSGWSCVTCKEFAGVQKANTFHSTLTDGNGYVTYDGDSDEIIIAFSGTGTSLL
jgi:hypothetical protein